MRDQPDDLVVGEHALVGQPVQALGRHAVGAAQVAAVGQRDPEVGRDPAEAVTQRSCHPTSLGAGRLATGRVRAPRRPTSLVGCDPSRFLLSRRWIAFFLVVVVLAYAAWWLGEWQFHRLDDRKRDNAVVERNEAGRPGRRRRRARGRPRRRPGGRVAAGHGDAARTSPTRPSSSATARARGPRASTSSSRWQTDSGEILLVDRGWMATDNGGRDAGRGPGPTGRHGVGHRLRPRRRDRRLGRRSPTARRGRSRARRSARPSAVTTYGGFVELASEDPSPDTAARARRAARPEQRPALLLRPPVVVLRAAGRLRVLLPRVRRVARAARAGRAVRPCGACLRRPGASHR